MESNLNPKEQRIAILHIPGEEPIELPILSGTEGKDVIDIKNLSAKGYFTYDPGLLATASCQSKITFINGEKGILLHRGYPIAELAMQTSYLELCYLLLYKELPNQAQLSEFKNKISHNTMVHERELFPRSITSRLTFPILRIANWWQSVCWPRSLLWLPWPTNILKVSRSCTLRTI